MSSTETATPPAAPPGSPPPTPGQPLLATATERVGAVVLILLLVLLTQSSGVAGAVGFTSTYQQHLTTLVIYALALMGLNLLTGNTGLISIAHAAFMGVGAFFAAYFVYDLGVPLLLAIPLAGLLSAGLGLMFGVPSLRLAGVYLVMASFAAQMILFWFFEQARWLTHGAEGRPVPRLEPLMGIPLADRSTYFLFVLAIAVTGAVVYLNILRSGLGRSLSAVREHPVAAQLMGVNLLRAKLTAFAVGHFYAGVAGALYAWHLRFVATETFSVFNSIQLLAAVIIGGLGTLSGAVFGAIFIVVLPEVLDRVGRAVLDDPGIMSPIRNGVIGLIVVVFLIYEPRGIARAWRRVIQWVAKYADPPLNAAGRKVRGLLPGKRRDA